MQLFQTSIKYSNNNDTSMKQQNDIEQYYNTKMRPMVYQHVYVCQGGIGKKAHQCTAHLTVENWARCI